MAGILKKLGALAACAVMVFTLASCGGEKITGNLNEVKLEENDVYAEIKIREYGTIRAKLFTGAAPESVARFIEKAEAGYYDGKTIHRIIDDYLIQGGSINGDGSDGDVPKNEFVKLETSDQTYNFYGALCFAATPKKGSYVQFYIVDRHTPQDIDAVIDKLTEQLADESISSRMLEEDKKKYTDYLAKLKAIPAEAKEKYKRVGGIYDLDGENTVFGQVIDGWDVLEAVSSVEVVTGNKIDDSRDTPSKPIDTIIIDTVDIIRIEPEETTEATTTKKASKTKASSEKINAETLPTAAPEESSDADTTAESGEAADTTAEAAETADTSAETSESTASEEAAAPDTEASEAPATLEADEIEPMPENAVPDNGTAEGAETGSEAEVTIITSNDDEVVIIED
ncbi:MAG: peptidylprolyl isomerase [Ruminiclostridium sp.]|nr:peptidylprolyl isomerase [Ruminiclostridium sp.]